jgi:hypothetical protein
MKKFRSRIAASLAMIALLACGSCSEGTVEFGGDREDTKTLLTVRGTFDDIVPVSTRDIVVFIYTNLRDPGVFQDFDAGDVVVIKSGTTEFAIETVESGDLTVVFLLDNPGTEADGQIDEGDTFAELRDPDNAGDPYDELQDVRSGLVVEISDIDIDFIAGTADARDIRRLSGG